MSTFHEVSVVCQYCGRTLRTGMSQSGHARAVAVYAAGWTHPCFGEDRCPDHPKPPSRKPLPPGAAWDDWLPGTWK